MNYADRIASSGKPTCFGNSSAYSLSDDECRSCRYQHTCREEVDRKVGNRNPSPGFVPLHRVNTSDSIRRREDDGAAWQPGLAKEGESPMSRLAKDVVVGALRGASKETYEFFRVFRIR